MKQQFSTKWKESCQAVAQEYSHLPIRLHPDYWVLRRVDKGVVDGVEV